MNNYPPGVSGDEPQIIGWGTEDKCERCTEQADPEVPLASIPDGIIEAEGMWLCSECADDVLFGR